MTKRAGFVAGRSRVLCLLRRRTASVRWEEGKGRPNRHGATGSVLVRGRVSQPIHQTGKCSRLPAGHGQQAIRRDRPEICPPAVDCGPVFGGDRTSPSVARRCARVAMAAPNRRSESSSKRRAIGDLTGRWPPPAACTLPAVDPGADKVAGAHQSATRGAYRPSNKGEHGATSRRSRCKM
jgi:hypothetical protein